MLRLHGHVGKAWRPRWLAQVWRTGGMYQQRAVIGPDLKCQFALVRMPDPVPASLAQRLVESSVQRVAALFLHRQTHDALQQPGVLRKVRVIHFGDFVTAVVIVVQRQ
ncbi:hypothetical protein D3C71_1601560 [compost metagenome]